MNPVPDARGWFGVFGGRFAPETLMGPLLELERYFLEAWDSKEFRAELDGLLVEYVGRETPLTFASRLTAKLGGAKIYLKREDLTHTGAHKINNALGQVLLARRMGKTRVVAETGAGQHGVATATVAARFGMKCCVYMGRVDMERQQPNVHRMRLLGADVVPVDAGTRTLKDAVSEAMRDWVGNLSDTYYLLGSALGPHPYPLMVRCFQAVIGSEARRQLLEREGRLPDHVVACVGGGSNSIGMFHAFLDDAQVALTGVEAGGRAITSGEHAARFAGGAMGVLQGTQTFVLQTATGQIDTTHSISAGLDYAAVGPEHAYLRDLGRARYVHQSDQQALDAFRALARLEGILPALESSHAVAYAMQLARSLRPEQILAVCLSGRGDKDLATVLANEDGRGAQDSPSELQLPVRPQSAHPPAPVHPESAHPPAPAHPESAHPPAPVHPESAHPPGPVHPESAHPPAPVHPESAHPPDPVHPEPFDKAQDRLRRGAPPLEIPTLARAKQSNLSPPPFTPRAVEGQRSHRPTSLDCSRDERLSLSTKSSARNESKQPNAELKARKASFIPFVVAGDPSIEVTGQVLDILIEEGADAVELGIPFSDALADGPVIQAASERACRTTIPQVLELVEQTHRRHPTVPLILFTYYNPLLKMGLETFAQQARAAGAWATLVVDLPVEEASPFIAAAKKHELKTIFLAAPTTSDERLATVGEASTGFVYCISRAGVTGERTDVLPSLHAAVERVRRITAKPVAVGFGISTPEQAAQVGQVADAVVVGSAFVRLIAEGGADAQDKVRALARAIKAALPKETS